MYSENTENTNGLQKLADNEIVARVHKGDDFAQEYIINKYKGLVKIKARTYFLIGGDREDIIQEGMIGLYKAIRDYNTEKTDNFYSFAELCISRQMMTAVKSANRKKHMPLNSYLSLNRELNDNDNESNNETTYMELISDRNITNPEDVFIGRESRDNIQNDIFEALSKLEKKVLIIYLKGKSYTEIAKILGKEEKSIDNTLQRIKKKVEKIMLEKNSKI